MCFIEANDAECYTSNPQAKGHPQASLSAISGRHKVGQIWTLFKPPTGAINQANAPQFLHFQNTFLVLLSNPTSWQVCCSWSSLVAAPDLHLPAAPDIVCGQHPVATWILLQFAVPDLIQIQHLTLLVEATLTGHLVEDCVPLPLQHSFPFCCFPLPWSLRYRGLRHCCIQNSSLIYILLWKSR